MIKKDVHFKWTSVEKEASANIQVSIDVVPSL